MKADPSDDDAYGELLGWWTVGKMIKEEKGRLRALRVGRNDAQRAALDPLPRPQDHSASASPNYHGLERRIVRAAS